MKAIMLKGNQLRSLGSPPKPDLRDLFLRRIKEGELVEEDPELTLEVFLLLLEVRDIKLHSKTILRMCRLFRIGRVIILILVRELSAGVTRFKRAAAPLVLVSQYFRWLSSPDSWFVNTSFPIFHPLFISFFTFQSYSSINDWS